MWETLHLSKCWLNRSANQVLVRKTSLTFAPTNPSPLHGPEERAVEGASATTLELKGKLLGGVAGLALFGVSGMPFGGPLGFVVGSLLGHYWLDKPKEDQESVRTEYQVFQQQQRRFLQHVFALCAKVAKADGAVNRQEINHMEQLMRQQFRLNEKGRAYAVKIWKQAKEAPESFVEFAEAFYQDFRQERHRVVDMLDLLFAMAAADGGLHPKEEYLLRQASGIFHISSLQYDNIKKRYYHLPPQHQQRWDALDPHYALLGAKPGEPLDVIKKKFRALAMQWHPDKLAGKGLSTEAMRHAKEKFQQINEAYERILESRQKK